MSSMYSDFKMMRNSSIDARFSSCNPFVDKSDIPNHKKKI